MDIPIRREEEIDCYEIEKLLSTSFVLEKDRYYNVSEVVNLVGKPFGKFL